MWYSEKIVNARRQRACKHRWKKWSSVGHACVTPYVEFKYNIFHLLSLERIYPVSPFTRHDVELSFAIRAVVRISEEQAILT